MEKYRKCYRIADVDMEIAYESPSIAKLCRDYETISQSKPEWSISVSESDIKYEEQKSEEPFPREAYESLAIYRKICERVVERDCFLFHCSAVSVDGRAYLFAAPSGTGKSTHTRLWRQYFGERAVMINDDKPLIKIQKDGVYVYGTPWCGKHGLQTNKKAPVQGICVLARGEENTIKRITPLDAYPDLYKQTYRPREQERIVHTLALLKQMAEQVPLYKMYCNISKEAAVMAWDAMRGGK